MLLSGLHATGHNHYKSLCKSCCSLELLPLGNFKHSIRAKDFWIMSLGFYLFFCFESCYVERMFYLWNACENDQGHMSLSSVSSTEYLFLLARRRKGMQHWIYKVIFRPQCLSVWGNHSQHILTAYVNCECCGDSVIIPPYWRTDNVRI